MGRNGVLGQLRGIDAFSKTVDDARTRTNFGAMVTLFSLALIATLTLTEFMDYRKIHLKPSLVVDKSRGEKLNIGINITFPRVPCYLISMDIMDISGEHQNDIHHDITRTRIDAHGKEVYEQGMPKKGLKGEAARLASLHGKDFCGSCYGGEPPASGCCNTCEDVKEAYARKGWSFTDPDHIDQCVSEGWSEKIKEQSTEGCNVAGMIHVNKVVGNFHLSPGRAFQRNNMHVHDLVPYLAGDGASHHDFGHVIHEMTFSSQEEFISQAIGSLAKKKPRAKDRLKIVDPLAGVKAHTEKSQFMFQYFLKVVPTEYAMLNGEVLKTHQYSVTSYERDLSPGAQAAAAAGMSSGSSAPHQVQHGFVGVPGVYINVDPSALKVVHTETRSSLSHFLTSTCAIVGGILTISGLAVQAFHAISGGASSGGEGPFAGTLPRSASGNKLF